MSKKGAIGEGVLMIYRMVLVAVIAIIIIGLSAIYYDYYINVRGVEARILTKQIVNCLAPEGIVDLAKITDESRTKILDYCKINHADRFYVRISVYENNNPIVLQQGDSGLEWVKEIYKNKESVQDIKKYEPESFSASYNINLAKDGKLTKSFFSVEVWVSHEF